MDEQQIYWPEDLLVRGLAGQRLGWAED